MIHAPDLEEVFPRIPLGTFPTPVTRLDLPGVAGDLWVKRDDRSGDEYGGNKVRKLEFLLAVARREGAGRVVTAGALGSHHALATTVYGHRLGFGVSLVLCPQKVTDEVRHVLKLEVDRGAEIRIVPRMELIPPALVLQQILRRRERPYVIPPGGSNAAGTLGYVRAALELLDQVDAGELPLPDTIHVACGTMGTAVGLAVGLSLRKVPTRVKAVRVVGTLVANERGLKRLARDTLQAMSGLAPTLPSVNEVLARLELRHDQVGPGYAKPTAHAREAMTRFGRAGLELDPTYTAKTAAGLLSSLEEGGKPSGAQLYWHTLSHGLPEALAGALPAEVPEGVRRVLEPGAERVDDR